METNKKIEKFLTKYKHLPGQHDQRKHGNRNSSDKFEFVDTVSQLKVGVTDGDKTTAYFIMPDDRLFDAVRYSPTGEHYGLVEKYPKIFGAVGKYPVERWNSSLKSGAIRVRYFDFQPYGRRGRATLTSIDTQNMDTPTLRRLQKLYDKDKLALGNQVEWGARSNNRMIMISMGDFLMAKYVVEKDGQYSLKQFDGYKYKHLRGQHDQMKHGRRNVLSIAENNMSYDDGGWGYRIGDDKTIAKGDDTELYRWANLYEVVEASRGRVVKSMDVTDKPEWYFAPPSVLSENATTVEKVYGRIIFDREALRKGGWSKDDFLKTEGAWRYLPKNVGRDFRNLPPESEQAKSYLDAIRGFEIVQLPTGSRFGQRPITPEDIAGILKFRLGREIPVIFTNVPNITTPFD